MGYYISVMIGIRTGGVFSSPVNLEDIEKRIKQLQEEKNSHFFNTKYAMTKERHMTKGDYIILAGVSNGWNWKSWSDVSGVEDFAKSLSKEFGTEVIAIAWNEQTNKLDSGVFLDGDNITNVEENPISRIIRRVT